MSRDVYSLRIFSVASLVPATGLVGPIVPSGFIYVVRDIDVVRRSTASGSQLEFFSPTLGLIAFISDAVLDLAFGWHWRGRQVYSPGERVGFQSVSGTWDITASGYQLTLP